MADMFQKTMRTIGAIMSQDMNGDSPSSSDKLSKRILQDCLISAAERLSERERIAQKIYSQEDKSVTISFVVKNNPPTVRYPRPCSSPFLYRLKIKCYEMDDDKNSEIRPFLQLDRVSTSSERKLSRMTYRSYFRAFVAQYSGNIIGQVCSRTISGSRYSFGRLTRNQLEDLSYFSGYSVQFVIKLMKNNLGARWIRKSNTIIIPLVTDSERLQKDSEPLLVTQKILHPNMKHHKITD
jgi:hypothetical protein